MVLSKTWWKMESWLTYGVFCWGSWYTAEETSSQTAVNTILIHHDTDFWDSCQPHFNKGSIWKQHRFRWFSLLIFRCCSAQSTFTIYLKLVLSAHILQLAAKQLLSLQAVTQVTIHCAFSLENWKQDNLTQDGKQVLHTPPNCCLSVSKSWISLHFHDWHQPTEIFTQESHCHCCNAPEGLLSKSKS